MNTFIQEESESSLPIYNIPHNYRERAEWFLGEFGETLNFHLENLIRFCGHLKKDQAISFSGITSEGDVHAHYGQYSLYFPIEKIANKIAPVDWMNQYTLEIDNNIIPIDSGMQEVQRQSNNARSETSTVQSRVMETLLPGNLVKNDIQKKGPTSQTVLIKRVIRIKSKNIASV